MKISIWNVIWLIVYCIVCYFNYLGVCSYLAFEKRDAGDITPLITLEFIYIIISCWIFNKQLNWLNKKMSKKYRIF